MACKASCFRSCGNILTASSIDHTRNHPRPRRTSSILFTPIHMPHYSTYYIQQQMQAWYRLLPHAIASSNRWLSVGVVPCQYTSLSCGFVVVPHAPTHTHIGNVQRYRTSTRKRNLDKASSSFHGYHRICSTDTQSGAYVVTPKGIIQNQHIAHAHGSFSGFFGVGAQLT